MNPDHLIELAEEIVQVGTGYPRQATINRAVSTAYYALFHALARECVARTVRSPKTTRYWQIVAPIYRSVDHGSARRVFDRLIKDPASSGTLKNIGEAFLGLQSARIVADYDPSSRYTRREALDFIVRARLAIDALRSLPKEDRLVLAVQLITKPR